MVDCLLQYAMHGMILSEYTISGSHIYKPVILGKIFSSNFLNGFGQEKLTVGWCKITCVLQREILEVAVNDLFCTTCVDYLVWYT